MNLRMRFRIVNEKNNEQNHQRDNSKDPSIRQNSATKHQRQSTFLEMVKNSYDFYMTVGKDQLREEQMKIAKEKEDKVKKIIKKQAIASYRQIKKAKEQKKLSKPTNSILTQTNTQNPKQTSTVQTSRRSARTKSHISYTEPVIINEDRQIFDVLDIEEPNQLKEQKDLTKETYEVKLQKKPPTKREVAIQKIQKIKAELIFEEEGTYELGLAHESMLRAQKFIDQHINFRHQIRQAKFLELASLIKYLKSHGFVSFDQDKFHLLTKINPYLYTFSESDPNYMMTFKLNGLEVEKRLESTRRRMSQVAVAAMLT